MKSWGSVLKLSMKSLWVFSWLMDSIVSWIWAKGYVSDWLPPRQGLLPAPTRKDSGPIPRCYINGNARHLPVLTGGPEEVGAHLDIKGGDLLLIGGRGQKIAHLGLERVIHLHVNVVTGCLLLVVRVHATRHTGEGATSLPPARGQTTHTQGARNQTCCFALALIEVKGKPLRAAFLPLPVYLMTWLMTIGSGCCSNPASFMGISEKRSRPQLKIWGGRQRVGDALVGTWGSGPSRGGVAPQARRAGAGRGGGGVPAYLAEVAVAVDVLALVAVLQLVVFDVEPQGLHDGSPRLRVHPQQPRQAGVQLVLWGLAWTDGSQRREKKTQSRLGQGQEGFPMGTCPRPR